MNEAAKISAKDDLPKALKPEIVALTESELRKLLNEAKNPTRRAEARGTLSSRPWFYPAILLAAFTGARRGEVLGLRWSDVDLEKKTITIRQSLAQSGTMVFTKLPKNDRTRPVSITSEVVTALRSHHAVQAKERLALGAAYKDADLVFAEANGGWVKPWNYGAAFADLVKRAGVTRIRLHELRHTHASLLAAAGVPIEVLSKRLGHASIAITADRYMHLYRDRDVAAAEAFERAMARGAGSQ